MKKCDDADTVEDWHICVEHVSSLHNGNYARCKEVEVVKSTLKTSKLLLDMLSRERAEAISITKCYIEGGPDFLNCCPGCT